jgi:hypothetical protein
MLFSDQKYITYGLTPLMQKLIKAGVEDVRTRHISEVFAEIQNNKELESDEKSLVIFEIGRGFERKQNAGR